MLTSDRSENPAHISQSLWIELDLQLQLTRVVWKMARRKFAEVVLEILWHLLGAQLVELGGRVAHLLHLKGSASNPGACTQNVIWICPRCEK